MLPALNISYLRYSISSRWKIHYPIIESCIIRVCTPACMRERERQRNRRRQRGMERGRENILVCGTCVNVFLCVAHVCVCVWIHVYGVCRFMHNSFSMQYMCKCVHMCRHTCVWMHVCISACLQMCVNHLVCASYICVLCVDTLVFECMCPPLCMFASVYV